MAQPKMSDWKKVSLTDHQKARIRMDFVECYVREVLHYKGDPSWWLKVMETAIKEVHKPAVVGEAIFQYAKASFRRALQRRGTKEHILMLEMAEVE